MIECNTGSRIAVQDLVNEINSKEYDLGKGQANQILSMDDQGLSKIWIDKEYTESGTTPEGIWVKFSDGTMIQYAVLPVSNLVFSPHGALYYADPGRINFPEPFINEYISVSYDIHTTSAGLKWCSVNNITTVDFDPRIIATDDTPVIEYIQWFAIGRWK